VKEDRPPQVIKAPRGTTLNTKGWSQEGALRMLMNNLDPEVAEKPEELIVYGGTCIRDRMKLYLSSQENLWAFLRLMLKLPGS